MDQPQFEHESSSDTFPKVIAFTILNTRRIQIHHENQEIHSVESTPVSSSSTTESSPKVYSKSIKDCLLNESSQFDTSELNDESLNLNHSYLSVSFYLL